MKYVLVSALAAALSQSVFAADMPAMPMDKMPMKEMPMQQQTTTPASARATGTIKAINLQKSTVTIAHGDIPALKWPAMTMGFKATPEQLAPLQVGEQVEFEFNSEGMPAILSIAPLK
ncbi:copper-binding protein [Pseudomonas sp. V1]|uniref:copper-binding protein n=1 Tax=Pseudomonas arcuscaelestis TaxID=2710591 RepID=UPI00193FE632|nr:copper-binding protein [Pseudomonas arcuscaelestis]MBM3105832.1 copper-binding protein [Pseudomonas arcuscaelestis]